MKVRKKVYLCHTIIFLLLQGCAFDFTPAIPTIGVPPTINQPFQGFGPTPTDTPEMVELKEAIEALFDPYQGILKDDILYEGSVYQAMDDEIREAYKRCGFNLEEIGASLLENPMTQDDFYRCLPDPNQGFVDPYTGNIMYPYDWLVQSTLMSPMNPANKQFLRTVNLDEEDMIPQDVNIDEICQMNFERIYLGALMEAYPDQVGKAKEKLIENLLLLNEGDPSGAMKDLEALVADLFEEMQGVIE